MDACERVVFFEIYNDLIEPSVDTFEVVFFRSGELVSNGNEHIAVWAIAGEGENERLGVVQNFMVGEVLSPFVAYFSNEVRHGIADFEDLLSCVDGEGTVPLRINHG